MTTIERTTPRLVAMVAATLAIGLVGCAGTPSISDGVDVLPKAHKKYIIDGKTLSFAEFEARLQNDRPTRLVIETSRERDGAACATMLGFRLEIPVWFRSLNGRLREVRRQRAPERREIIAIEQCL